MALKWRGNGNFLLRATATVPFILSLRHRDVRHLFCSRQLRGGAKSVAFAHHWKNNFKIETMKVHNETEEI